MQINMDEKNVYLKGSIPVRTYEVTLERDIVGICEYESHIRWKNKC